MRFLLLAALPLLCAAPSFAASFDCSKAGHKIEKLICSDEIFSKQDDTLAAEYAKALARVFDKNGLRDAQRNWQKWIRAECMKTGCDIQDMEKAYDDRIFYLQDVNTETYEASYKSTDIASLGINHIDGNAFDFSFIRQHVDADRNDPPLCRLPASDDEPGAVATMNGPDAYKASWSSGEGCMIDFTFIRDKKGSVTAIDVEASDTCRYYCGKPGEEPAYNLGDHYLPVGDWVPYDMAD